MNPMTSAHQTVFPWLKYPPVPPPSNKMELPKELAGLLVSFGTSSAAALPTASAAMVVLASPQHHGLTSWPHSSHMDIREFPSLCQRPPLDTKKAFIFSSCVYAMHLAWNRIWIWIHISLVSISLLVKERTLKAVSLTHPPEQGYDLSWGFQSLLSYQCNAVCSS